MITNYNIGVCPQLGRGPYSKTVSVKYPLPSMLKKGI